LTVLQDLMLQKPLATRGARDTDKTTNWFYIVVDTSTAKTGGIKGGGYPVSVGPVTISA